MSRLERKLERKHRRAQTGTSRIIGEKGEYCRRVIINQVTDGGTRNRYLHATKGWKERKIG